MQPPMKLGISSCLLGNKVRYDGGHKQDRYLTDMLGQYVEYVPVCPEVEYGLPIPREALRQVGDPLSPRLVEIRTGMDHTEGMTAWARRRVLELEKEGLCGFVFKSRSPSSGMERVRVYNEKGVPLIRGNRHFRQGLHGTFPPAAGRGGRATAGCRTPREFHRAHFRPEALAGNDGPPGGAEGSRGFPYAAQVSDHGAQPGSLPHAGEASWPVPETCPSPHCTRNTSNRSWKA